MILSNCYTFVSMCYKIDPVFAVSILPVFANSVCNPLTSEAVNAVIEPNLFASSVRATISLLETPKTAARLALLCSKSLAIQ